jgi:hypothetical protein
MRATTLLQVAPLLALLLPAAGGRRAAAQSTVPSPAAASVADLLPDVVVDASSLEHLRIDDTTLPGHRLLRMSTSTPNIGAGPLEIRGSTVVGPDQQQVLQRIYRSDGSFYDRLAGTFVYHPTHQHTHFDGWAVYRLRSLLADGSVGPIMAEGDKASFCLLDVVPYDLPLESGATASAAPPYRYTTCGQMVQGISPGWADVYDLELDGQWIDITNLPNGPYWLEAEVDPEQRILELPEGESNNLARIRILLDADSVTNLDGTETGGDAPQLGVPLESGADAGLGAPPELQFIAPAADVTWVEHSYEGLPVQWRASDPDGDALSVALYLDRDPVSDAGRLALGGYQDLRGEWGQAVINTAALDIGTWYLFAEVTAGGQTSGSRAHGSIVLYIKGDLDFDGHVDRRDWVMLVQRRRELRDLPLSSVVAGWEHLLDEDRDGDVDEQDIDLFRSTALRAVTDDAH